MKYLTSAILLCFVAGIWACATPDEPRHASPPPGSHSPFAPPDETNPDRDQPEPDPDVEEEEDEPDEPVDRD